MQCVQAILDHPLYIKEAKRIEQLEQDRIYCKHDFNHLMDVARIAYIRSLEQGLGLAKSTIYAAAILHDIGRACELEADGEIDHAEAGAKIAEEILTDLDWSDADKNAIVSAIAAHRGAAASEPDLLANLIKEADNLSRRCWDCEARDTCKWGDARKNLSITW